MIPCADTQNHRLPEQGRQPSYWQTAAGRLLLLALAAGGLLLGYEYRTAILASSLFVWLPPFLCIGMHFFMHRGHGKHGSRRGGSDSDNRS
ncbi:DUF2933 domain-containing protein [Seohaeicola nanhaiensis]|uniref:DUF2933 domain-containing protein n=1 Tax=Seohaeicola nanhaiensis TaxID=1387282 RepID=A0ABV9KKS3_9RHOB